MLCCVPGLPFRTGVSFPTAGKVVPEAEPPPREAVLSGTRRDCPGGNLHPVMSQVGEQRTGSWPPGQSSLKGWPSFRAP